MNDDGLAEFKKLRVAYNERKLKGSKEEAVFVNKRVRMTQESSRNSWYRSLRTCGIPYRKPHNIRHTIATRLMGSTFPIKMVADLLGHTIQNLLSTYTHRSPEDDAQKRDMVEQMKRPSRDHKITDTNNMSESL